MAGLLKHRSAFLVAIEVKASRRVSSSDIKGLEALSEDVSLKHRIVVSTELRERRVEGGVVVMPVETFLERLWSDAIIEA